MGKFGKKHLSCENPVEPLIWGASLAASKSPESIVKKTLNKTLIRKPPLLDIKRPRPPFGRPDLHFSIILRQLHVSGHQERNKCSWKFTTG